MPSLLRGQSIPIDSFPDAPSPVSEASLHNFFVDNLIARTEAEAKARKSFVQFSA